MNADQRDELRALRAEQWELQAKLQALETRLLRWESDAEEAGEDATLAAMLAHTPPAPAPVTPPQPVPRMAQAALPPPLPPVVAPATALPKTERTPAPPPLPVATEQPAPARESLEMQIGTTWLVRAGIVLVLTSLAFLGSYLYYHIVPTLGPAAKIALMYLGAGALTGVGAWLERSRLAAETEGLRNYARVVLAGGLAAVYYVTYSAHWNPHLRVVSDPLLAGGLLLGWAAFMVWLANRRGSELLATFAILLAFYTSAVNEISSFRLVANLFLACGAVYLLRRHLWQIFPFVSLLATFGSYGFWRFSHAYIEGSMLTGDAPPHMALTSGGFWVNSGFLFLYWLLFTWAVFTTDERVLPAWRRAGFVTVNNSAFFLLTTWLLLAAYPGTFWKWSLGFGLVLLALAETSRRRSRVPDADTENAYLLQGILLVTLGFIGYFSGWQLSLVLAVQSAVLLWRAGLRTSRVLLGSSCAVACVSLFYALDRMSSPDAAQVWTVGLAESALLIGNAWWSQRLSEASRRDGPANFAQAQALAPWWFAVLGSAAWFWTIENAVSNEVERAPLMAGAALLLTASIYVLRVKALPWIAQIFLFSAGLYWLANRSVWTLLETMPPVWNTSLVLGSTLALGHWWQWQRTTTNASRLTGWVKAPAVADALLAVVLLGVWLHPHAPWGDAGWMAEAALLSLALLGYGLLTRYRALAAAGQLLLLVSVVQFFNQWDRPWDGAGAERWLALVPLAAILATLAIGRRSAPAGGFDQGWLGRIAVVYEGVALVLFLFWVGRYVPPAVRFPLLVLGGALIFGLGCLSRVRRWLVLSIVPTVAALCVFWLVDDSIERRSWLALAGALLLAAQQQFGKRWLKEDAPAWFPAKAQGALMTAAVCCAWAFLTARMERWEGSAFTLAASWSLFAPLVLAAGLVLRERVYRWLGLLILAATLGHIVLFDLSGLDSLGRAISSFALGLVVLGMGFFYNRYHSKIRDLL